MLKIIGTFESFPYCVLVTASWDGEPSVQIIWCHAEPTSWLIRTAPLNCMHRTVPKTHAFTLCLRDQVWDGPVL